jgi:histidyl-tRNA synthetase
MNQITQPLKGFRDFLAADALKRCWLKNRLEEIFALWGYDPMETPTLEPLELFAGQIGEDEKLFYQFEDNGGRKVALRYDQTVPTCRVVGANWQELENPFKRYQIQAAFRAENPQKGRYREFVQADADIFGIPGPAADAEVISLSLDIYRRLGFQKPLLLINDRSLLKNIPYAAIASVDKLDKIGEKGVIEDMVKKGILEAQAEIYFNFIRNIKPNDTIKTIFSYLETYGFPADWFRFEPTLARSFSYSTGPIWEVKLPETGMSGSVLGGERYDLLIEKISGKKIPGTGFGLGFDRTLEACESQNLVPKTNTTSKVLVTVFSPDLFLKSLTVVEALRTKGINAELFPDSDVKLEKQIKFAVKKEIPYLVIIGPDEVASEKVTLKNLSAATQETIGLSELSDKLLN